MCAASVTRLAEGFTTHTMTLGISQRPSASIPRSRSTSYEYIEEEEEGMDEEASCSPSYTAEQRFPAIRSPSQGGRGLDSNAISLSPSPSQYCGGGIPEDLRCEGSPSPAVTEMLDTTRSDSEEYSIWPDKEQKPLVSPQRQLSFSSDTSESSSEGATKMMVRRRGSSRSSQPVRSSAALIRQKAGTHSASLTSSFTGSFSSRVPPKPETRVPRPRRPRYRRARPSRAAPSDMQKSAAANNSVEEEVADTCLLADRAALPLPPPPSTATHIPPTLSSSSCNVAGLLPPDDEDEDVPAAQRTRETFFSSRPSRDTYSYDESRSPTSSWTLYVTPKQVEGLAPHAAARQSTRPARWSAAAGTLALRSSPLRSSNSTSNSWIGSEVCVPSQIAMAPGVEFEPSPPPRSPVSRLLSPPPLEPDESSDAAESDCHGRAVVAPARSASSSASLAGSVRSPAVLVSVSVDRQDVPPADSRNESAPSVTAALEVSSLSSYSSSSSARRPLSSLHLNSLPASSEKGKEPANQEQECWSNPPSVWCEEENLFPIRPHHQDAAQLPAMRTAAPAKETATPPHPVPNLLRTAKAASPVTTPSSHSISALCANATEASSAADESWWSLMGGLIHEVCEVLQPHRRLLMNTLLDIAAKECEREAALQRDATGSVPLCWQESWITLQSCCEGINTVLQQKEDSFRRAHQRRSTGHMRVTQFLCEQIVRRYYRSLYRRNVSGAPSLPANNLPLSTATAMAVQPAVILWPGTARKKTGRGVEGGAGIAQRQQKLIPVVEVADFLAAIDAAASGAQD